MVIKSRLPEFNNVILPKDFYFTVSPVCTAYWDTKTWLKYATLRKLFNKKGKRD